MNKGIVWMLHSVEEDSPRTAASELYANLTLPPARLESLVAEARQHGYTFVSMRRFLSDLADGLEHRNILLTFDDGFRNVYTDAFPLLRRLEVPFVLFVATDFIAHGFRNCARAEMDGMMIVLDQAVRRGADFGKLFRRYRRLRRLLPFWDGRRIMDFMFGTGIDYDRYWHECVCSAAELREMADSGLCEIGSHTDRHVHVDRIGTRRLARELRESKRRIEDWMGRPCEYFSYPYGHADAKSIELIRRHFRGATRDVTVPPYGVSETSDPHLLPRIICTRHATIEGLLPA